MLEKRGVTVYVRQSEEAVQLLGKVNKVGMLVHFTCYRIPR